MQFKSTIKGFVLINPALTSEISFKKFNHIYHLYRNGEKIKTFESYEAMINYLKENIV